VSSHRVLVGSRSVIRDVCGVDNIRHGVENRRPMHSCDRTKGMRCPSDRAVRRGVSSVHNAVQAVMSAATKQDPDTAIASLKAAIETDPVRILGRVVVSMLSVVPDRVHCVCMFDRHHSRRICTSPEALFNKAMLRVRKHRSTLRQRW